MIVYVVGGDQREDAHGQPTWAQYGRAIVARVDTATGAASVCLHHDARASHADAGGSIVFGAATLANDRLYACTKTEVCVYSVPAFRLLHRVSLPMFNDLHHVRPTADGGVRVVVTGLDMVVECTLDGAVTSLWNAIDTASPWGPFSPEVDYRQLASTKPHRSHPNFTFDLDGRPWVTRLEQRDAVCLVDRRRRMEIAIEQPHDGIVTPDGVWFTTVDGHLVRVDSASLRVDRVVDVGGRSPRRPGWCRGLDVRGDLAVVGFSRLRWTRWPANLSWLSGGLAAVRTLAHRHARLAVVALDTGRIVQEIDLRDLPISAIFSVHIVTP